MLPLVFNDTLKSVEKIKRNDFTAYHHDVIENLEYDNKKLIFTDKAWSSVLLGAGEEKAVYCICDHNNKVFALEVIDEKHYLNGRLINGEYFFSKHIDNIAGIKFNSGSLIGLTFTGLVKAREFIYGYEWGRFQLRYDRKSRFDMLLTFIMQIKLAYQFRSYEQRYKDVHDRNVMFELKDKSEKGKLMFYIDSAKKLKWARVSIRAIDVR